MRANLPFGLPTAGPQTQHQKLIQQWGLDTDNPKVPRQGNPQTQQQKPVKAQAQQHTGEQSTMSKKKTIKEKHEGGLNTVRTAVKQELGRLINNMSCREESHSINDILNSCSTVLTNCKSRLYAGELSNDYTNQEISAQYEEINSLGSQLREHGHNLFSKADERGFGFIL